MNILEHEKSDMPTWVSAFLVRMFINLMFWSGVVVMTQIWTTHGQPSKTATLPESLAKLMDWQLLVCQLLTFGIIAFVAMILRRVTQRENWIAMVEKIDDEIAVLAINVGSIWLSTSLLRWKLNLEPLNGTAMNAGLAIIAYILALILSKR